MRVSARITSASSSSSLGQRGCPCPARILLAWVPRDQDRANLVIKWVVDSDNRFGPEDLIVTILTIQQFQLIELHVFSGLFELIVLFSHLFLKMLDKVNILVARWSSFVKILQLFKPIVNGLPYFP